MARGNPGKIVIWTDKAGATKYGIAYNKEQEQAFINVKKLFVRHVLEEFTTKETDPTTGKNIVGLVDWDKCKVIGRVD
jgi:hypothetical protein